MAGGGRAGPLWEVWKCSGEGLELMNGVRSDATANKIYITKFKSTEQS